MTTTFFELGLTDFFIKKLIYSVLFICNFQEKRNELWQKSKIIICQLLSRILISSFLNSGIIISFLVKLLIFTRRSIDEMPVFLLHISIKTKISSLKSWRIISELIQLLPTFTFSTDNFFKKKISVFFFKPNWNIF